MSFTKLHRKLIMSTVWREPDHVRILWITMLALTDQDGVVQASLPGLADAARLSIERTEDALERLGSPDKFSQSRVKEGRRIERHEDGWLLINYERHRDLMSAEEQKRKRAERQKRYRERKKAAQAEAITEDNGTSDKRNGVDGKRNGVDGKRNGVDESASTGSQKTSTRYACRRSATEVTQPEAEAEAEAEANSDAVKSARVSRGGGGSANQQGKPRAKMPSSGALHELDMLRRSFGAKHKIDIPTFSRSPETVEGLNLALEEYGWDEVVRVLEATWLAMGRGAVPRAFASRIFIGDGFSARRDDLQSRSGPPLATVQIS